MEKKVSIILSIVLFVSIMFCMSGTKIYDKKLMFAEQVANKAFPRIVN